MPRGVSVVPGDGCERSECIPDDHLAAAQLVVVLLGGVPASALFTSEGHAMSGSNAAFYAANLRLLERNSMTFLNTYVNVARSSPSRASLLTSLHPRRQIGIMNDASLSGSPVFAQSRQTTFTNWVRSGSVGMQSFGAGRVFKTLTATISNAGFQQYAIPRLGEQDDICPDSFYCVFPEESSLTDDDVAERAVSYLRQLARSNQPFSLVVGFHRSYGDKSYPTWTRTQMDRRQTSIQAQIQDSSANLAANPLFTVNAQQKMTSAELTQFKMATYGSVQWVDFCLGRIIEEMRALRFWENSIIIVTSDVAGSMGEFSDKSNDGSAVYEYSTRVPLYIRDPRAPKSFGRRSGARIELVDLATSVYDLVGASFPPNGAGTSKAPLQGVSVKPLIDIYQNDPRSSFTSDVYFQVSLRHAAYSESARCTDTNQPYGGLPAGSTIPSSMKWTDCPSSGTRMDAIALSLRTANFRYTEYRTVVDGEIVWETNGLLARELFSHEGDDGLEKTVDGNRFELNNVAPCTSCHMLVPPIAAKTASNPSIGLATDPQSKEYYTAPSLPVNLFLARLVRAYSLMLRANGRDGKPLCSNHGIVNPDDGSCSSCDDGWTGAHCERPGFPELDPSGETPITSSPTTTPSPTSRPPVGAPTPPSTSTPTKKVTAAPTKKATAAPTYRLTNSPTNEPTVAPTGPPTVQATPSPTFATCDNQATQTACQSLKECTWENGKCSEIVTSSPTIPFARKDSCASLSNEAQCARINGCVWQGRNLGCQVPLPTACGCDAKLEAVEALVPSDRSPGAGEWQLFRNKCHALCRGAVPPTPKPTPGPTPPTRSPTTPRPTLPTGLPLPNAPGEGNAQPVDTLTLYLVLDASKALANEDKACTRARGFGCLHITAIFYFKLIEKLREYVTQGWAAFRIGVWAYSCQDETPLWIEIRAPLSGDSVFDKLRDVRKQIQPRGGRCPSKVFDSVIAHDASERLYSPNRALLFLASGVITPSDLEQAKAKARTLRQAGVATFGLVIATGNGSPNRPVQTRLDSIQIVGHAERIFIASPKQGALALVTMLDPVAAAILAIVHEPTRIYSSQEGQPEITSEFLETEGYSETSGNGSRVGLGIAITTVMLLGVVGSYLAYRRYRLRVVQRNVEAEADDVIIAVAQSRRLPDPPAPSRDEVYEVGHASPQKAARRRSLDIETTASDRYGIKPRPFSLEQQFQIVTKQPGDRPFDV